MISIRQLQSTDAKIIVKFNENTDADFLNQWAGGRYYTYPITEEQIINRIKNTDSTRYFAVLKDSEMIGTVELDFINWEQKECTVCRFLIGTEYRGYGYGTKTLKLAADYSFSNLKMEKVKLSVFDFNISAIKCYEKAGFKVVGNAVRPNGWTAIQMEFDNIDYK